MKTAASSKEVPQGPALPSLLLLGFSLLCLALAFFSSLGWLKARSEAQSLETELALTRGALTDARQHLEAERLLSQRQLEMLRNPNVQGTSGH